MASLIYNNFLEELLKANIDFENDTFKLALVTSSYTPDRDTHDNFDDITNEVSGTGYTAGGAALANLTVTQDNTNDKAVFDAYDVTWASSTITARAGILYKVGAGASTSPLIGYIDFTEDKVSTVGNFIVSFNASGIITVGESA